MAKFKVAAGKHHQRQADGSEKTFVQGETLEMTASEAAKFPNKFIPVVEDDEPDVPDSAVAAVTAAAAAAKAAAAKLTAAAGAAKPPVK
jgi:hypothetical protein